MFNKKNIILALIILLAAFLRLWKLSSYPALNADEAAIGYNAWSLLETGLDEHGNSWPIHFQSFNDYKPGLYFYLVLPFVKFLGLNELAVRLPGALFGIATVLAVYLLVVEIKTKEAIQVGKRINANVFPLVAAFFIAISPWHLHFSRGGWEVSVATFFITFGLWLFLKAVNKEFSMRYLVLSVIFFVFSLYTYHAARVVVPLLVFGLAVIFRDKFVKNLKPIVIAGAIGLILVIPLVHDLTKGEVLSRATGVGLFADPGPLARINEQRGEHGNFTSFVPQVLHNKAINYGLAFSQNWGEHFWGEFLFLTGDVIQRNKVPETGQMYLFDILFLAAGGIAVIRLIGKGKEKKGILVVLLWLVVAPTAAALTFQSPHALRAHNMVVPLTIISAYGLVYLSYWLHKVIPKKKLLYILFALLVFLIFWNFTRYLHMYWVHMAKEYPYSSQYGVKELVTYVKENQDNYDKVLVTDRYDQPYSLFLFYSKYPPQDFQRDHTLTARDNFGFSTVRDFGKYHFENIVWDVDQPSNPNSLIIGTDEEIPDEANVVKEIYGSNGYKYFDIVAN